MLRAALRRIRLLERVHSASKLTRLALVERVEQLALIRIRSGHQMPVRAVDHLHARPIRRASVKMSTPAARFHVAYVCRRS